MVAGSYQWLPISDNEHASSFVGHRACSYSCSQGNEGRSQYAETHCFTWCRFRFKEAQYFSVRTENFIKWLSFLLCIPLIIAGIGFGVAASVLVYVSHYSVSSSSFTPGCLMGILAVLNICTKVHTVLSEECGAPLACCILASLNPVCSSQKSEV